MPASRFIVVACVVLVGASAAATTRTATTSSPARGETTGKFVWHELVTDDTPAVQRFYGGLLGWQFMDVTRLNRPYTLAHYQGKLVAGFVGVDPVVNREVSQWIGYQSVKDVDGAVAAVEKAGGQTLRPPTDVPVGRAAVVGDPDGAPIGLLRLAAGDPADEAAPRPHSFFWMEYIARDVAATTAFYTQTFGYNQNTTARLAEYIVLTRGRPRGGILPAPRADLRSAWLPYVLVDDPVALIPQVRALGGSVLLEPRPDIRRGSLAVVTDPSGAMLALQKFPF